MNTTTTIDNSQDVIDSRDVIARIEELEAIEADERDSDEQDELTALLKLQYQAEPYSDDWKYGATLISESYFTDYTEELLKDCGYLPAELPSWIVIDWEETAENVKVDYTSVEFDGVTYWIR